MASPLKENGTKIAVMLENPPNNPFPDCRFNVSLRIQLVKTIRFYFDGNPKAVDARSKIKYKWCKCRFKISYKMEKTKRHVKLGQEKVRKMVTRRGKGTP